MPDRDATLLRWGLPAAAAAPWAALTSAISSAPVHVVAACFALRFLAALVPVTLRPSKPTSRLRAGVAVSLVALVVALDPGTPARLAAAALAGLAATLCSSAITDGYKAASPAAIPLTASSRAFGALAGVTAPLAVLPALLAAALASRVRAHSCELACRSCAPWSPRQAASAPLTVLSTVLLIGTAPVLAHGVLDAGVVMLASALGALAAACASHRGVLLHRRSTRVRVTGVHARLAAPACAVAGLAACAWSLPLPPVWHLTAVLVVGAALETARYAALSSSSPGTVFARAFLAASGVSSLVALALVTWVPAHASVLAGTLAALVALAHLATAPPPVRHARA